MTLAGDSILVTPGSGATVATHIVNAKEHQVIMQADEDGHIQGSKLVYAYNIPEQVHVAGANTKHWSFWNGDSALLVRVLSIQQRPSISTAVTGIVFTWKLNRITSAPTGGGAVTAWLPDLSQTALDADIILQTKPSGGSGSSTTLLDYAISSEETNAATQMFHMMMAGGVANLVPLTLSQNGKGILLRPSQGLECVQVNSSAAGNTGWVIVFTVE